MSKPSRDVLLTMTDWGGVKTTIPGLLALAAAGYMIYTGGMSSLIFALVPLLGGLMLVTYRRVTTIDPDNEILHIRRVSLGFMNLTKDVHSLEGYEKFDVSLDKSKRQYVMRIQLGQKLVPLRSFKKRPQADREARLANGFMDRVAASSHAASLGDHDPFAE